MIELLCVTLRPVNRILFEGPGCLVVEDSEEQQLKISASGMAHILGPNEERRLLEYLIERAGGLQNLALEHVE